MDVELINTLTGEKRERWRALLSRAGLRAEETVEETVLLWEEGELIAAASRQGNLLKCVAVDPDRQGEGLLSALVTPLRQEAFRRGLRHLFLYTKPGNEGLFTPLLFYSVARTDQVLLMEDRRNGIRQFLDSLPAPPASAGPVGAAVMNCDPFTLGHRSLIERAAGECGWLYVFLLSEDRGRFSAADRRRMAELGTADLPNVTVLPTGPYLISQATFPTYFLPHRDQAEEIQCRLDLEIFTRYFVPRFQIQRRYVGTEPLSPLTARYNRALHEALPPRGVEVRELPRREAEGVPISASAVRAAWERGELETLRRLVPPTTCHYLQRKLQEERR